ncbi:MAG: hypothetical protein F4053_04290 [Proteobacteria bacterium]|nr:hypothetical protein [Pseudomonadota bacterium]
MDENWLIHLENVVRQRALVVFQFVGEELHRLRKSPRGLTEFTIARDDDTFAKFRRPTACLVFPGGGDDVKARFGLVGSHTSVSTLESRVKVRLANRIRPSTKAGLLKLIAETPHSDRLRERLESDKLVTMLTSSLSAHVIRELAQIDRNHGTMRSVAESLSLSEHHRTMASLQRDAVQTALRVFDLFGGAVLESVVLGEGQETALARVSVVEDAVVEHDARHVPGYDLAESDLTGRAVFTKGSERLEVYTANRRPLERVFGVDLIYLNATRQNIVMPQYKMLEPRDAGDGEDWIYRPDDQLESEIERMRTFQGQATPGAYEYRLNSQVFYLRFVKRDAGSKSGVFTIPIDHFERLRADPGSRGPRGGFRISIDSLAGRYLRQTAFQELVRSGYIGANAETTKHLKELVRSVVEGDKSVVAAIQSRKDAPEVDMKVFDRA